MEKNNKELGGEDQKTGREQEELESKKEAHRARKVQRGAATKSGIPAVFDLATPNTSYGRYAYKVRRVNVLHAVQRLFIIR